MDATMRHFSAILDQLIENNKFFATYFQGPFCFDYDVESLKDGYNAPADVAMYCGATRGALIDFNWDEIVKFDLDGYEADEAPCNAECDIYAAAKDANLEQYFARPRYLGTYVKTIMAYPLSLFDECGEPLDLTEKQFQYLIEESNYDESDMREITIKLPLYAYEKAHNVGWTCDEYEDEEGEIASSYDSPLMERAEEVAASFVHEYGEHSYAALSEFLNEWRVNDIHCGNIGWVDGRLVLIDYAGYHC